MPTGCGRKAAEERRAPPTALPTSLPLWAHAGKNATEPAPHAGRERNSMRSCRRRCGCRPEVVRSAGIKTASAVLASLPATVDLTGESPPIRDRSARLAARVPGPHHRRQGEGRRSREGGPDDRRPGIARAGARPRDARVRPAARAKAARLNADRLKSLEAKSLASGQEVAAAEAEAAALEAEVAAAKQTLAALGQGAAEARGGGARVTIRTPLGGLRPQPRRRPGTDRRRGARASPWSAISSACTSWAASSRRISPA